MVYYVPFSLVYTLCLCAVGCLTECVLVLPSESVVLLCKDFTNKIIKGEGLAPVEYIYAPCWL